MKGMLDDMTAASFIKEVHEDEMSLLHHAVVDNDYTAVEYLASLKYFPEIIN